MNRIITILVTIFILLLLYIWISHVWGSDNPRRPKQIVDSTEAGTLGADDPSMDADTTQVKDLTTDGESVASNEEAGEISEEPTDEEPVAEETVPQSLPAEPVEKKVEERKKPIETPSESKAKAAESKESTVKTSQPITPAHSAASPNEGKHLVIAGNFLQRVNADQRMQELKKAGFEDVEVVNFDLSEYHTVCAGRFDDVNEARRLVRKLKDYHKIDAYVRVGS